MLLFKDSASFVDDSDFFVWCLILGPYYPNLSIQGSKIRESGIAAIAAFWDFEIGEMKQLKAEENDTTFDDHKWDKSNEDSPKNKQLCYDSLVTVLAKNEIKCVVIDANRLHAITRLFLFERRDSLQYLNINPRITNCPDYLICDPMLDFKSLLALYAEYEQIKNSQAQANMKRKPEIIRQIISMVVPCIRLAIDCKKPNPKKFAVVNPQAQAQLCHLDILSGISSSKWPPIVYQTTLNSGGKNTFTKSFYFERKNGKHLLQSDQETASDMIKIIKEMLGGKYDDEEMSVDATHVSVFKTFMSMFFLFAFFFFNICLWLYLLSEQALKNSEKS